MSLGSVDRDGKLESSREGFPEIRGVFFALKARGLRIGFIGAGTVGNALAKALTKSGYKVTAISSLHLSSAQKLASIIPGCKAFTTGQEVVDNTDLIFITTPDDAIAQVVGSLKWSPEKSAAHCCGAYSSKLLDAAQNSGASTGVFHPLQTFAAAREKNLKDVTFAIEAEGALKEVLKEIANTIGQGYIELEKEDWPIYHVAAVFASNYLVTLINIAQELWGKIGFSREEATRALLPLIKGTVKNIEEIGLPECLTGPISRGDKETIRKHLAVLRQKSPEAVPSYCELGLKTLPVALEKGRLSPEKAQEIEGILLKARTTSEEKELLKEVRCA